MKEKILNVSIFLVVLNAVAQLAVAQIHIKAITQIFTTKIGIYLFFFILTGLVTAFNAFSIKRKKNFWTFTIMTLACLVSGITYLYIIFNDLKTNTKTAFADISTSIYLTVAALIIYLIGYISVAILMPRKSKRRNRVKA